MSYIVPREKPKCYNCPFRTLDYCGLLIEHDCVRVNVNEMTVSKYCPLVEIPTPHGRLGDLDKLEKQFKRAIGTYLPKDPTRHMSVADGGECRGWTQALMAVQEAKTVIEAEGSEK